MCSQLMGENDKLRKYLFHKSQETITADSQTNTAQVPKPELFYSLYHVHAQFYLPEG